MSQPAALKRLAIAAGLVLGMWVLPTPDGLTDTAWHLFAVFVGCIFSLLLRGLPIGAVVMLCLCVLGATHTLSFEACVRGFGVSTLWLVVAAFMLAGAVKRTGLGRRAALMMVRRLGSSILGLGYAICGAELILGPVVPSNTARGGGVLAPVVQSLARALGSEPDDDPDRAGAFLVQVGAHANIVTAAMFLTGMAANPLVSRAASDVLGVDFGWGRWALGALVPGLLSLALLPPLLVRLSPPTLRDTRVAQREAERQLVELGPWSRPEKILSAVFVSLIWLWCTKPLHGMGAAQVAWIGICVLLLAGAQTWQDFASEAGAWDALVWLGGLLTMATALKDEGFVAWGVEHLAAGVSGYSVPVTVLVLALAYFYSMYGFSMLTGHIAALVSAFFALGVAAGVQQAGAALVMVAIFAYFSDLCACLTNYATGPAVIYSGLGYVPVQRWLRNGLVVSFLHLGVWLTVGAAWWWVLGWWSLG